MSDTAFAPSVGGVRSILPVLAAALLLQVLISLFQLDFAWTRWLYEQEGGHWLFREHWLFSDLIHSGGRRLSVLLALICIGLYAASFPLLSLRPSRHVLAYLAVAPLLASTAVSVGKNLSGVDCPWSLYPFGGDVPYRPLLQQLLSPGDGACFPAGHASAGYAWFALYFAASVAWPRARIPALFGVLMVGLVFGFAQQLRGAHFLSHDLWSLTLCWSVCAGLAPLMLSRSPGPSLQPAI